MRTYNELIRLPTFEERFQYCRTGGMVGRDTLGFDRYLSQIFYATKEWKDIRRFVIARDLCCDLAIRDRELNVGVVIHHLNPLTEKDFKERTEFLLDPKYMITTCGQTHLAIHYGDGSKLPQTTIVARAPNDTCPWR